MKRSDYEVKAQAFRALLAVESLKPQAEQNWPEYDEWLSVPGTNTCTTPTCAVFGQEFPVTLHENADGIFRGMCGRCGTETIPVPTFEEE